jgi:hypothetical protein
MKKAQALVKLSDADMEALRHLTSEAKSGTAAKVAILDWLRGKGYTPTTQDERGGYNAESVAYWAGYNYGKTIDRPARMQSLSSDFEAWAQSEGIEISDSVQMAWEKGICAGWTHEYAFVLNGTVGKDVSIWHMKSFYEMCSANGVRNLQSNPEILQELWLLSSPDYGE